jgi:succinoglycan biosynthesis transport protein ExoP
MDQNNNNDEEYRELTLGDIWRIFKKRFWWFFITTIVVVAITGVYLYFATPIYEASSTIKLEPKGTSSVSDIFSQVSMGYGSTSKDLSTEFELIKSRSNIEKVIKELGLTKYLQNHTSSRIIGSQQIVDTVQSWVNVSPVKDTQIAKISVQNPNPTLAASIANELAKVYNDQLAQFAKKQYSLKSSFIESQIPSVEKDLTNVESTIREFKEKNGIFELSSEADWLLKAITNYDQQINALETDLAATSAQIQSTQKLLLNVNQTIVSATTVSSNPIVSQLKSKLVDLRIQLSGMESLYPQTDQHVKSIKNQIQETESQLEKQVTNIISSHVVTVNPLYQQLYNQLISAEAKVQVTQATLEAMKKIRATYENKLKTLPLLEQKLADLERQLKVKENLYTLLLEKLEETKISEAGITGNSEIIDTAYIPIKPIKPNKKLTLAIGGVLGIFLGLLVVFIVEYADRTLKEEEDVERISDGIPIIGRIPLLDFKDKGHEIFVAEDPTSPYSEAVKITVMNALYSTTEKMKKILLTSPTPGDGKTIICGNMAQAFAQNGEKTLIVDLDMRKPRMEKAFGISERAKKGVTSCIAADLPVEEALVHISDNLDILPVGPLPPNPTAILTSKKMKKLIENLESKYDRILFDTAPTLAAADAGIISHVTDGVVLVVRMGKTARDSLKLALSNLTRGKSNVLGIVLNGVSSKNSSYYYYYYYYTEEGGKKKKKRRRKN